MMVSIGNARVSEEWLEFRRRDVVCLHSGSDVIGDRQRASTRTQETTQAPCLEPEDDREWGATHSELGLARPGAPLKSFVGGRPSVGGSPHDHRLSCLPT